MDESDETNSMARLTKALDLKVKLELLQAEYDFEPAIQGEILGPGIQKNKYKLDGLDLYVCNLIRLDELRCVDHSDFEQMLGRVGLKAVPLLGTIDLNHSVDALIQMSIGKSKLHTKVQREGLIFRPLVEEHEPMLGGRLSFKAINPKFLLKYDE
jgi:hypothetical protein